MDWRANESIIQWISPWLVQWYHWDHPSDTVHKIGLFLVHCTSINNVCVRVIENENIHLRVQCKCAHAHIKMQVLDVLRISWIQKHLILSETWTRWSSYETGNWYRLKPCLISQNKKCRGYLKSKLINKK